MNGCWPDGDLRAFVDGELTAESRQRIAGHLEVCASCSERHRELGDRAARVYSLLAGMAPAAVRLRVSHRRQWAVAGLSLAAALAIGFVVMPKRRTVPPVVAMPNVAAVAVAPVPAPVAAVRPRSTVRHAPERRAALEEFLRLDDEPLETGVVVRITAENGDVQADLLMGPDGRAHAIRVVSNQ